MIWSAVVCGVMSCGSVTAAGTRTLTGGGKRKKESEEVTEIKLNKIRCQKIKLCTLIACSYLSSGHQGQICSLSLRLSPCTNNYLHLTKWKNCLKILTPLMHYKLMST